MQLLPDLYRMEGVRGANCFLITTMDGKVVVVDTGMPGQSESILANISAIGKKPEDVKEIILTHADMDHSGSAMQLRERTGAKIAAHEWEALVLSGKRPVKQAKGILRIVFAALRIWMPPMLPFLADRVLQDGEVISGWKMIFTPGHTQGSICLYLAGKALLAGDALCCDKKGNPIPPIAMMSLDMPTAMQSVAYIATLEFDMLLPGHGVPCLERASERVAALISPKGRKNL
jgi:hydroxyacylglutathione hydrolase